MKNTESRRWRNRIGLHGRNCSVPTDGSFSLPRSGPETEIRGSSLLQPKRACCEKWGAIVSCLHSLLVACPCAEFCQTSALSSCRSVSSRGRCCNCRLLANRYVHNDFWARRDSIEPNSYGNVAGWLAVCHSRYIVSKRLNLP